MAKFSANFLLFGCCVLFQALLVSADFRGEFKYNVTIPPNDMYYFIHDFEKGTQAVEYLDTFRVSLNLSMVIIIYFISTD